VWSKQAYSPPRSGQTSYAPQRPKPCLRQREEAEPTHHYPFVSVPFRELFFAFFDFYQNILANTITPKCTKM
jgi:hypothetical protein